MPQLVNLAARNIVARFPALGQTNADPRVWRPEYERVQLIMYAGDEPRFSVLWENTQRPLRQIMDLVPLNLGHRPALG